MIKTARDCRKQTDKRHRSKVGLSLWGDANDSMRAWNGGQTEGHGERCGSSYFAGRELRADVAARAVGADVFEITVNDPVVGYGMARAIFQHQQEDSLANDSVFGCCPEFGSGTQCGIPVCCIVIRWIDGGRDRGHFRLREFLRSVAEVK